MQFSYRDIAHYYDTHQFYYSRFWSPTALHYGFWYKDTQHLSEAVTNANQFVLDLLGIDSSDIVLDAGCGVAGTSLYIAESTGARVIGITLSTLQLAIASKRVSRSAASHRLGLSRQDYTCTAFRSSTFSKLFGIESACHANSKRRFLAEAYRLMKPGGRIAIVDAFLTKDTLNADERKIYTKVIDGWVMPSLPSISHFARLLAEVGFQAVAFFDMQQCVERSIRRIYLYSQLTWPLNLIKSKLGIARENMAARYQKFLFKKGIAVYGAFYAVKGQEERDVSRGSSD